MYFGKVINGVPCISSCNGYIPLVELSDRGDEILAVTFQQVGGEIKEGLFDVKLTERQLSA